MSFAERLKAARKKANMTQKDLANNLHVTPAMIAQYEIGNRKPGRKTLGKIANALKLGYNYAPNGEPYFYAFVDTVPQPDYAENEKFNKCQYKDALSSSSNEENVEAAHIGNVIAHNLKESRNTWDISVNDVSNYTGIEEETIKEIEDGKLIPSLEQLKKLSNAYNTTIENLLSLPEHSYKEIFDEYVRWLFDKIGLSLFKVHSNGQDKIWALSENKCYEIALNDFNSFMLSVEDYSLYSLERLLDKSIILNNKEVIDKKSVKEEENSKSQEDFPDQGSSNTDTKE